MRFSDLVSGRPFGRTGTFLSRGAALCLLGLAVGAAGAEGWVPVFEHATRADFAAGTPGHAGRNLLVDRDGRLRTLHRFDFNQDGAPEVLVACGAEPQDGAPAAVRVFRGPVGFGEASRDPTVLPGLVEGGGVVAADLDGDGHADLVYVTGLHPERLALFYGSEDGFREGDVRQLELPFRGGLPLVADLNRDGLPDLVVVSLSGGQVAVVPGGEGGFGVPQVLETGLRATAAALGDLDGDDRLDLVLAGEGELRILSGTEAGAFDAERPLVVRTDLAAAHLSLADFDCDGRLDLLVHHGGDAEPSAAGGRATGSAVFWNRRGTFAAANRLLLPAGRAGMGSVADLNRDGFPDLLLARRPAGAAPLLLLGGRRGRFRAGDCAVLAAHASVANLLLDFDGDGELDALVYAVADPAAGAEGPPSGLFLYHGSAAGWSVDRRDVLPAPSPVARLLQDPGNLSDRGAFETYVSQEIDVLVAPKGPVRLLVEAEVNARQRIRAFLRESGDEGLGGKPWWALREVGAENGRLTFEGTLSGEALQYKLELDSGFSGAGPTVKAVRLLVPEGT